MACTTILVGKDASYDGSTIIARNEDSANGEFCPKRFIVVKPDEQPRHYKSVLSHVEVDLPGEPLQYTAVPNADLKEGIWGEAGVNEANVAMSATETLTTNERVLGADPFVELTPAKGKEGEDGYEPEVPGGIGEEDFLTIVLPYVKTAREGVQRLGPLPGEGQPVRRLQLFPPAVRFSFHVADIPQGKRQQGRQHENRRQQHPFHGSASLGTQSVFPFSSTVRRKTSLVVQCSCFRIF